MSINTSQIVSITEANQNFSRIARLADEKGSIVIMKNNRPKYLLVECQSSDPDMLASDEDISSISRRLIQQNQKSYKILSEM